MRTNSIVISTGTILPVAFGSGQRRVPALQMGMGALVWRLRYAYTLEDVKVDALHVRIVSHAAACVRRGLWVGEDCSERAKHKSRSLRESPPPHMLLRERVLCALTRWRES